MKDNQDIQLFNKTVQLPHARTHIHTDRQTHTHTLHRSYIFYFLINHWFSNGIETITIVASTAQDEEERERKNKTFGPPLPQFGISQHSSVSKQQSMHNNNYEPCVIKSRALCNISCQHIQWWWCTLNHIESKLRNNTGSFSWKSTQVKSTKKIIIWQLWKMKPDVAV